MGEISSSSSGKVLILGTTDEILGDVSVDSAGSVLITGNTAQTLGEALLASDGWSLFGRVGELTATLGGVVFSATGTVFDAPKYYHNSFITDSVSIETSMLVEKKSNLLMTTGFNDNSSAVLEKKTNLIIKKKDNTNSNLG
jgi:hypothetical protein